MPGFLPLAALRPYVLLFNVADYRLRRFSLDYRGAGYRRIIVLNAHGVTD